MNYIPWLTGKCGAGKSTLVNRLCRENGRWLSISGGEMRKTISVGEGFSRKDRRIHNLRLVKLAKWIESQLLWKRDIVIDAIAPIQSVRDEISKMCPVLWIYIKRDLPERDGHFYDEPKDYLTIDNDQMSKDEAYQKLLEILREAKKNKG